MKKRSKAGTLFRMLGLVKPLAGFMVLAVVTGTLGFLAVQFIPVLGGYAVLNGLGYDTPTGAENYLDTAGVFALLRAVLILITNKTIDKKSSHNPYTQDYAQFFV